MCEEAGGCDKALAKKHVGFSAEYVGSRTGRQIRMAKGYVFNGKCRKTNVHAGCIGALALCKRFCPGELLGGSPAFLMQKDETPGAVSDNLENA